MNIELEDEKDLNEWWQRYLKAPEDVIIISDIPYSYYEIRNELVKRQNMRDALEDLL